MPFLSYLFKLIAFYVTFGTYLPKLFTFIEEMDERLFVSQFERQKQSFWRAESSMEKFVFLRIILAIMIYFSHGKHTFSYFRAF